jgi:hypothetical protein
MLELGDRELNQLSRDIDTYATGVKERAREGELREEELTSTTLRALMPELARGLRKTKMDFDTGADELVSVVEECRRFGIKTTTDLKALFTPELYRAIDEFEKVTAGPGLTRDAMMFSDAVKYFTTAWQEHWTGMDPPSVKKYIKKYGAEEFDNLLKQHGIFVEDPGL